MSAAVVKVKRVQIQEIEVPNLGDRLESARMAAGLSVSAVCRQADISRNYWYQLVNDSLQGALAEPTLRKLEAVLKTDFGVAFDP